MLCPCGGQPEWDPDAGSTVCTSCGTLQDASQTVLANELDYVTDSARHFILNRTNPTTLKSVRSGSGPSWDLAGQGKEASHERNKLTIHESIRTLAIRLAQPGAAPRAQVLFDIAMQRAKLRWGRIAKLASGATLALALREASRGDLTNDIAYLLDVSPNALSRAQIRLIPLLELTLPQASPTAHIPALITHLTTVVSLPSTASKPKRSYSSTTPNANAVSTQSHTSVTTSTSSNNTINPASAANPELTPLQPTCTLPNDLQSFLRPLLTPSKVPAILHTADGLFQLLTSPSHPLSSATNTHPSKPPEDTPNAPAQDTVDPAATTVQKLLALPSALAASLLILSLEAHAMPVPRAAPHVLDLAKELGKRISLGGGVIMERYRVLVDVVEKGIEELPWLTGDTSLGSGGGKGGGKGKGKGKSNGAGVGERGKGKDKTEGGRRGIVAKAVVDVVQFRQEVWRRKIQEGGKVDININEEDDDEGGDGLNLTVDMEGDEEGGTGATGQNSPHYDSAPTTTTTDDEANSNPRKRKATTNPNLHSTINSLLPSASAAPPPHTRPTLIPRKPPKRPRSARTLAESFLLSPLSSPSPSASSTPKYTATTSKVKSHAISKPPTRTSSLSLEHTTHLLAPEVSLSDRSPTRLQLLAAMRGGEGNVGDEELFDEGELEGFLVGVDSEDGKEGGEDEKTTRDLEDDEMKDRRGVLWSIWCTENVGNNGQEHPPITKTQKGPPKPRGKERLNMEALARLLHDDESAVMGIEGGFDALYSMDGGQEKDDEDEGEGLEYGEHVEDGVEVSDWRPASPGGAGGGWDERFDD